MRLRSVLLPLAALALATGACGDTDDTAAPDTGEPTTTAPVPTEPPLGAGPYPIAELDILVEHPDLDAPLNYQVVCLGDTATVLGDPVEVVDQDACATLARPEVVDRLVAGPAEDRICTEQYGGPDTATITGTIDDQPVDTVVDRVNGCGIADWDELLAGLVPPALGVTD